MTTKALKKQLAAAIAMVLVAGVALSSSTYAWFVSNTKVSATTSSVVATSATPNLLIIAGTDNGDPLTDGGKTSDLVVSIGSSALYPASTVDCASWWAVNSWTGDGTNTLADGYYELDITETSNGTACYDGSYTLGAQTLNAYQVSEYSIYTTTGEMTLCLDESAPITVEAITSGTTTGFKDALRVGVVVNDELKVVYAPTAEADDATGNDADAVEGWAVVKDSTSTIAATYDHIEADDYGDFTAISLDGGFYQAAAKDLGSVDEEGVVVKVYVWLEGTDAQCLVGTADSDADANSYKVSLNFVGATVPAN